MSTPYTQFADLLREVEPPPDGTLSRTLHQDERLQAVLFGSRRASAANRD